MSLVQILRPALTLAVAAVFATAFGDAQAQTPKRGGVLTYVVPDEPPSWDGHRETTFALIHPIAPFYSTLIRVNPDNPSSPTDFKCDLCTEMPKAADGGKTYTFKLKQGVKFTDGTPLTAQDVVATFNKIISPPEGTTSARKAFFLMVDSVTAPDDNTVVFKLKYPSGAFIPALANPYNFIYSKAKLAQDIRWYEKNILGSGPFKFVAREAGAFIKGERNPDFYVKGQPYLDGFEAIFSNKQAVRVQAIRGDRAAIEFRGFPPKSAEDLVKALGKDITVQESDWNCVLLFTPNHTKKPFDDARVRRALSLAVDRWGGSKYLSQIAIVKAVGGVVFPGHPLAATKEELQKLPGFWPDLAKSREEAKRLLKEAGVSDLKFTLSNRAVDQPYTIVGTWLIDQWRQVGVTVEQKMEPTGPFYAKLRSKDFDVTLDFNCQSVINPLLDIGKFLSFDVGNESYGGYTDRDLDKMFEAMNRTADEAEQRKIMRAFEKRVLDDQAHSFITLWWNRIIPHRSYVKGWKISPSHYLNQDLANVWLDK
jgi:peptide/nickel transport system substrate-binding protein